MFFWEPLNPNGVCRRQFLGFPMSFCGCLSFALRAKTNTLQYSFTYYYLIHFDEHNTLFKKTQNVQYFNFKIKTTMALGQPLAYNNNYTRTKNTYFESRLCIWINYSKNDWKFTSFWYTAGGKTAKTVL